MTKRRRQNRKAEPYSKPILDIIVVSGGRFDMLRKCLDALEKQEDISFQLFIIDNASENHMRLRNKDLFERPIVTGTKRMTQEVGFPRANNDGFRMGNSPLVLFLNDDVALKSDALKEMVSTMDNPDVGIVGAKLIFPEDSTSPIRPAGKVQHVGMAYTINGDVIHPLVGWRADHPKCCVSREVVAVTGACLMIRRKLFNEAGGFWEGYGPGTYEDVDLCASVNYLGKKVFINVNAQGYHYTGATAEQKQRSYPLQQNAMTFKARWMPTKLISWTDYLFY